MPSDDQAHPDPDQPDPDQSDPDQSGAHRVGSTEDHSGDEAEDSGAAAVRSALARARAAAAARQQLQPRTSGRRTRRGRRADAGRSGAGPDGRDPQLFGALLGRLVDAKGWQTPLSVGGLIGRWDQLVGPDIAAHCIPESFTEGKLRVRTSSTAWATQLRLLRPDILRRITVELGSGVVTDLDIVGPAAPSWRRGRRSSGGRGPRDTYG